MIAGVLLIAVPVANNQNNAGVVHAATEVINGIEYQNIYLTSNNSANRPVLDALYNSTGNNRFVLQEDLHIISIGGAAYTLYGNTVILDLNGHTLSMCDGTDGHQYAPLNFYAPTAELTDSSLSGGGTIITAAGRNTWQIYNCTTMIISGGTCTDTKIYCVSYQPQIIFRGNSTYIGPSAENIITNGGSVTVAPYLVTEQNGGVHPYDYYAVSTVPDVSGVYNYEFSLGWDINLSQLLKLAVPTDYYLYVRNQDERYHKVAVYRNGQWVRD